MNCIGDEQSLKGVQLEEFHFIFVIDRSDEMIQIQVSASRFLSDIRRAESAARGVHLCADRGHVLTCACADLVLNVCICADRVHVLIMC